MKQMIAILALGFAVAAAPRPGWMGFGYNVHLQPTRQWLHVVKLAPGSPAEKAGLRVLDVITGANGAPFRFTSDAEALAYFKKFKPGERVVLSVVRGGRPQRIEVTAVPMPDSYYALWLRNEQLAKEKARVR